MKNTSLFLACCLALAALVACDKHDIAQGNAGGNDSQRTSSAYDASAVHTSTPGVTADAGTGH